MRRALVLLVAVVTGCTSTTVIPSTADPVDTTEPTATTRVPTTTTSTTAPAGRLFPAAPQTPEGPVDPTTEQGLDHLLEAIFDGDFDAAHLQAVVEGGDPRASWILADLLRFFQTGPPRDELVWAFTQLTGAKRNPTGTVDFVWAFDNLIAWDLPAWEGYPRMKGALYTSLDPRWAAFFQQDHGVDWRLVTWGGVLIDDRPLGDNGPCNCIPALDDPATTDAERGSWYGDDRIIFGVVVNGEAIALPKHQMEVHEMVNLTLGGRDLGIPYCTLCGSAQAYFTDNVPGVERVVLRTSGLLSRSNKLMYDLTTNSAIDTFTGRALTGPLGAAGVVLEQVSVVGARWGDWKQAHPHTLILAQDGGIGREYRDNPLGSRDANGPIFPVGDVDPRLPAQEKVIGLLTPDGTPIAFPVGVAEQTLAAINEIVFEDVHLTLTDALRVFDSDGRELVTHQAFWFAWSQFHPGTLVWTGSDN